MAGKAAISRTGPASTTSLYQPGDVVITAQAEGHPVAIRVTKDAEIGRQIENGLEVRVAEPDIDDGWLKIVCSTGLSGFVKKRNVRPSDSLLQQLAAAQVVKHVPVIETREILKEVEKVEVRVIDKIIEVPQVEYREKVVEVPRVVYEEKVISVPKVEVQEVIKEVERVEVQVLEREVEVPEVQYQERIVEVPKGETQDVVKRVPVIETGEILKEVEKVEVQVIEKTVDVLQVEYRENVVMKLIKVLLNSTTSLLAAVTAWVSRKFCSSEPAPDHV